jgi:hypothetical protein
VYISNFEGQGPQTWWKYSRMRITFQASVPPLLSRMAVTVCLGCLSSKQLCRSTAASHEVVLLERVRQLHQLQRAPNARSVSEHTKETVN